MRKINVSDISLRQAEKRSGKELSFKEKVEIAKMLDKVHVSSIELPVPSENKADEILVKTVAMSVKNSTVAVPVRLNEESIDNIWECVKDAVHPRLQVMVPLSTVQMEYVCHKKPAKLIDMIDALCKKACSLCSDVEFIAEDATRSDMKMLSEAFKTAILAGVGRITVCDSAGTMLPGEFSEFVSKIYEAVPELKNAVFGVQCSDELELGVACSVSAIIAGASDVKTVSFKGAVPEIEAVSQIIRLRGDELGVSSDVKVTELNHVVAVVADFFEGHKKDLSVLSAAAQSISENFSLSAADDIGMVSTYVKRLGYDLSADDLSKVYQEFSRISTRKKNVGAKELDAIIASVALQVPPTYRVSSYVINSGNVISATAHIALEKDGEIKDGISIGDGPIDAAFLAIEQIIGHHYELDDFQIQSVTEGREAMGSAVVKLRADGKLYSGKGISTDIIGASIRAYINALNKIVFEEV